MKYKLKERFRAKGGEMSIEVLGLMPGCQCNHIPTDGVDHYSMSLNGHKAYLSENVINQLFDPLEAPKEARVLLVEEKIPHLAVSKNQLSAISKMINPKKEKKMEAVVEPKEEVVVEEIKEEPVKRRGRPKKVLA